MFQWLLLLCCCLLNLPLAHTQIDDIDLVFEEMKALEGIWSMETDRGDRLEIWYIQDDSTMTARGLRVKKESRDTVPLETIRLELRGQDIIYWALARGQNNEQAIPFELTEITEEGEWIFENPKHDDPVKIIYWLLDNRELHVNTEGKRGGRDTKHEFVFEREFASASANLRIRAGINYHNLFQTGVFQMEQQPVFEARPGWEVAAQIPLGGQQSFFNVNLEAGFSGRTAGAAVNFTAFGRDTVQYVRDVRYRQVWLTGAVIPEIRFRRNGRFSLLLGAYGARLLANGTKGTDLPGSESKIFTANIDFKKSDLGLIGGFQYRFTTARKKKENLIGLRANMGQSNVDNLYRRSCEKNPEKCTGKVQMRGISVYYGVSLL